jgi:DNA polymerase III epsilon subunit-like protein
MPVSIPACSAKPDASFESGGAPLIERDLCFIDVETTGAMFGYHEVIEIGAIRVSADTSVNFGEINLRLSPSHPERLTLAAQRTNGYSAESWLDVEGDALGAWQRFVAFVAGSVPVCHNPSFDRAFLTLGALDQGITDLCLDHHWIGTESLGWPLFCTGHMERLSLEALCEYLGVQPEPLPHKALEGARSCLAVYRRLMKLTYTT